MAEVLTTEVAAGVLSGVGGCRGGRRDLLLAEVGAHRANAQVGEAGRAALIEIRDALAARLREPEELHGLNDAIPVLLRELVPRLCCSGKIAAGLRDLVAAE